MKNRECIQSPIILYGAGTQNLRMAYQPIVSAGLNVDHIIDNDENKQGKLFYGIEIKPFEYLLEYDKKGHPFTLVITIRTINTVKEVIRSLKVLRNAEIYTFDDFIQKYSLNCSLRRFSCVMTHLVDHCNLNCVRCSHFSTLDKKRDFYLNEEEFEKDCSRLFEILGDDIDEFQLSGGETLLHPRTEAFPYIIKKYFGRAQIIMITNATKLLEKPESFFESCRDNNVQLWISKYPIPLDYDQIQKRLIDEKIRYEIGNSGNNEKHPKEMWGLPMVLCGGLDGQKNFESCLCMQYILRNGRLYPCANSAYIDLFNEYFGKNLPGPECNSVSIYEIQTREQLMKEMSKSVPLCSYCDAKHRMPGIPWRVSERDITEWTLEPQ